MKKNDFSYLRYPPQLYTHRPTKTEQFKLNVNGKKTRVIYFNTTYNLEQISKIQQFKAYAKQHNKQLDCSDMQILRYLYTTQFDFKQSLQKIQIYLQWTHDPAIQTLSHRVKQILNQGCIFTYGRDKENRPIVYMDLTKLKLNRHELTDYFAAFNALLSVVIEDCFVHGVIENYMFVIDMGGHNIGVPIDVLKKIIQKIAIIYSMYLGKLLVINTGSLVKTTYMALKYFIHEQTRKKITLLSSKQLQKILHQIDRSQLMRKYKGDNPDIYQFWPPRVPNQPNLQHNRNMGMGIGIGLGMGMGVGMEQEESFYYSLDEENNAFFELERERVEESEGMCCEPCQSLSCVIF